MTERTVTAGDIAAMVRSLGLSGMPLCVHSSLRSFGHVAGGAPVVIDGLLTEGCTVLVPTFIYTLGVPSPEGWRLAHNGWDYDRFPGATAGIDRAYTLDSNEITRFAMGAIPEAVLMRSGRVRGNHPMNSFAALGPLAEELAGNQQPLDVYAPLRALAAAGGSIILMGVGYTRLTMIHAAEQAAGRTMFRRWANGPDGQPMELEVGSCSDGFDAFEPVLEPIARCVTIGQSRWIILPARETLERATRAIREDSSITHCARPDCLRCNDAVAGGPEVV